MRTPAGDKAGLSRPLLALGAGSAVAVAAVIVVCVARLRGPGAPEENIPRAAAGPDEAPPAAAAARPAEPADADREVSARPDPEAVETARMIESLLDDLSSPTRVVRMDALRALGGLAHRKGGEAVVPLLMEGARDEDPSVRCAAVRALATVGPRAAPAVSLLRELVHDRVGPMVARPAVQALGKIGPAAAEAVDDLTPLLSDNRRSCEVSSAEALAGIGGRGLDALAAHVEALFAGAGGSHFEKKIEAMGAGGRAAVPVLLKWLAERQSYAKRPHLVSITRAIARIGAEGDGAADALEALVAERDPSTYGPAVYALLSVDPERVDARAAAADLVQDLGRNTYRGSTRPRRRSG
ncbi:MAG: HEAT repeat domain-containing protein [Planctomycetota bacterium]|jgi:HEAT repeat protein